MVVASCNKPAAKEDANLTRIKQETSCSALQTKHDDAERGGIQDYMDAAFKRMRELRCFTAPVTPS